MNFFGKGAIAFCISGVLATSSMAQQALDHRLVGQRLILLTPMTGSGSAEDPVRPAVVPKQEPISKSANGDVGTKSAVLSWRYEVSDDGKTALVEIIAKDRSVLDGIRALNRDDVKIFELGKVKKEEIEAEFRKVKANFDATAFAEGSLGQVVKAGGKK